MTVTCFGFLSKTIFRLWLREFFIYNLQCFQIRDQKSSKSQPEYGFGKKAETCSCHDVL